MSGTEFHQLQSLALHRPINPETQERQVLYNALVNDPKVQATRFKMDYGNDSKVQSQHIRRKIIKTIKKFKTTKEDISKKQFLSIIVIHHPFYLWFLILGFSLNP